MRRLAPLALLLASGCSLVTNFDLKRAAETSDALCSDEMDNDGDGLTDCQDWKCLGRAVCCTFPVVVLEDSFEPQGCNHAAACDSADPACAIDPTLWTPWGQPTPVICQDGLNPHKAEQCYDVGVLSVGELALHPGLSVVAHVSGQPELAGRLEVGLTLQRVIASGSTVCSPIEGPDPVVSIREVGTGAGFQLVATFDRQEVGRSVEVPADGLRHEVRLNIGSDRRAHYALDGHVFADSPADQVFPDEKLAAHLALFGRGLQARVDDVRVIDGAQCEDPKAWAPAQPFVALDASTVLAGWDSFSVYNPNVWRAPTGEVVLYYTGCAESNVGGDCSPALGVGRAVSPDGLAFARDPLQRLKPTSHVTLDMSLLRPLEPTDPRLRGFESVNSAASLNNQVVYAVTDTTWGQPDDPSRERIVGRPEPSLKPGAPGSWDDGEVGFASALEDDNGHVRLWYAGRRVNETTWRIGTADSVDGGVTFQRDPANPILSEGAREDFDGRGVSAPEVVYDTDRKLYRMWYAAEAFLGVTSIGYAVSTDGVSWHKFPGNPVLTAAALGLETIGSPAILPEEGLLRLWVHGNEQTLPGVRIFGLVNRGSPPQ